MDIVSVPSKETRADSSQRSPDVQVRGRKHVEEGQTEVGTPSSLRRSWGLDTRDFFLWVLPDKGRRSSKIPPRFTMRVEGQAVLAYKLEYARVPSHESFSLRSETFRPWKERPSL